MQTAVLCYAQPMHNEWSLRLPLSVTPVRILPVNKTQAQDLLEKLAECLLYNFHRELILLKLKIKKLLQNISSKNLTAGFFLFLASSHFDIWVR